MKSFTVILGCLAALILGANGIKIYETENYFDLENVSELETYTNEFTEYDIKWKVTVEKAGDDLNVFVEPLSDISDKYVYLAFSFMQSGRTLNKSYFSSDIQSGPKFGGKVLDWSTFINRPESPFVVDDKTTLQVELTLRDF